MTFKIVLDLGLVCQRGTSLFQCLWVGGQRSSLGEKDQAGQVVQSMLWSVEGMGWEELGDVTMLKETDYFSALIPFPAVPPAVRLELK